MSHIRSDQDETPLFSDTTPQKPLMPPNGSKMNSSRAIRMMAFDVGSPLSHDMNIKTIEDSGERAVPTLQARKYLDTCKRNYHLV